MTRNLSTIDQFVRANPAFTEGAVRWAIFNQRDNGLAKSGALLRNGRRILIDVDRWMDWLETRTQAA